MDCQTRGTQSWALPWGKCADAKIILLKYCPLRRVTSFLCNFENGMVKTPITCLGVAFKVYVALWNGNIQTDSVNNTVFWHIAFCRFNRFFYIYTITWITTAAAPWSDLL